MVSFLHSRTKLLLVLAYFLTYVTGTAELLPCLCDTLYAQESEVAATATAGRQIIEFDSKWLFAKGDHPGAEQVVFDDHAWQAVDLPHDWAIAGPFDQQAPASGEGGFLPTGVGFYRKHFSLPESHQKQQVLVEFDGVMANSDVWINGHKLGHRPNGYVSFRYDLTDHLKFGEGATNVLAVRADTSAQVASRWYTGSGIYRHVRLLSVNPVHFDYDGVFVQAKTIEPEQATLQLTLTVRNELRAAQKCVLKTQIVNESGEQVAAVDTIAQLKSGANSQVSQTVHVTEPKLWNLEKPSMYVANTAIELDGKVVDTLSTQFGIRKAEFRADTGFWLNGQNLKIKGVCLHHCSGGLGAAVPLGAWEHRLSKLRTLGVNAIRTAHNPVAPEFLDLCDRMGFLVMDEFFDCWTVGKRAHDYHHHFEEWSHRDVRDTVLRDRNHPSIILYSIGNEIRDTHKEQLAKQIAQELVDICHEVDPTRPATQALFRPNTTHDYDNGLADLLDVVGTNYRDTELLKAWRDKPSRKIIGTEQSHDRRTWLACRDNPQHSGQFLWVGIDYLGESRRWPVTTFNAGLLDRTGHPHPRGYERQSWWSEKPMVHIFRRLAPTEATPEDPGYEAVEWKRRQVLFDDWTPRDSGKHSETLEIYSNCDEVDLLLNGQSLGKKPRSKNAAPRVWTTESEAGELTAVGYNNGAEVARHELHTAGPAHHIEMSAYHSQMPSAQDNVVIVETQIVDQHGTKLPRARQQIDFSISGPGKLIAVDCGSIVSHESFSATHRTTHQGRCTAVIRLTSTDAPVTIEASSAELPQASLDLRVSKQD